MKNRTLLRLLAAGMFLGFAFAGVWLLFLGFEIGDVYPPYSSHRSELDGTQILYEALDRLPEVEVARQYGPASNVGRPADTTLLVAGLSVLDWYAGDEEELKQLVRLADAGARVVVSLQPSVPLVPLREGQAKEREQKDGKKPKQPAGEKAFDVVLHSDERRPEKVETGRTVVTPARLVLEEKGEPLPPQLPSRSTSYLEPEDDAWKTVYSRQGRPALIRREQGRGEILLIADSYLLTNRAMWEARHPQFLIWLVGPRDRVLFFERHLGVAENPGVAWLLRKYHLQGLLAALAVIVILFLWRSSVPLVPPVDYIEQSEIGEYMDRGSSLLALVSRGLPSSQVLGVCLEEWKKTEKPSPQLLDRVEKLAQEKRDVVETYRQIVTIVRKASLSYSGASENERRS